MERMTMLHAVVLSFIEGLTEFLPVSSTGHLILAHSLFHIPVTDFSKSFDIIIQFGAILAVATLYRKKIWSHPKILLPVVVAFVPTAAVGLLLYPFIKSNLLESTSITTVSLAVGGLVLLVIERIAHKKHENTISSMPLFHAFLIGLGQTVAVIPGVSRAAATIVAAMLLGYPKKTAVEFSFLLAIPTIGAAAGFDAIRSTDALSSNIMLLVIGFAGAWISAYITVKHFIQWVNRHSLAAFGWYRISLSAVFWAFVGI